MLPPNLPQLKILPVPALIMHEDHDESRAHPLAESLRQSGILRNPPIVTPLQDATGRYLVLDGANRVTAIQSMHMPHILAQVVQPDDPNLILKTWNHVVWGMAVETFMKSIRAIPELELKALKPDQPFKPKGGCAQVQILLPDQLGWVACTTKDVLTQINYLHAIVNSYKNQAHLDRTSQVDIGQLNDLYHELTALVIFPQLGIRTIMMVAGQGYILPTGITRFTVSPRALHVNYPLDELSSPMPLAEKEAALQSWVQGRLKNKNVRYYAEATFLFDD
jgi:hypothetical protein